MAKHGSSATRGELGIPLRSRIITLFRQMSGEARVVLWILLILTAAGFLLRVNGAGSRQLWLDEVHTYDACNVPTNPIALTRTWWTSYKFGVCDPPLYYVASWLTAAGNSTYNHLRLRLPSVLFGTAAIPAGYFLFALLEGTLAGVIGAVFLTVSVFAIQYSQEHRPYALFLLTSILFYHAAFLSARTLNRKTWLYLFFSAYALIMTQYFGGLALAVAWPLWAVALFQNKTRPARTKFLAVAGLPLALAVAYLPVMIQWPQMATFLSPAFKKNTHGSAIEMQLYLQTKAQGINYLRDLLYTATVWRLGRMPVMAVQVVWFLAALGMLRLIIRRTKFFLVLTIWFIATTFLTLGFYELLKLPYDARRNIFQLPLLIFLEVNGILWAEDLARRFATSRLLPRVARAVGAVAVLGIVGIYLFAYRAYINTGFRDETGQADWRGGVELPEKFADDNDVVNVSANGETWSANHFHFYRRTVSSRLELMHLTTPAEIDNVRNNGRDMWFFAPLPNKLPVETLIYLAQEGQWIPLYNAGVVFLQGRKPQPRPGQMLLETAVVEPGEYVLAFPEPFSGTVKLSGRNVETQNVPFSESKVSLPIELEPAKYRLEATSENDSVTTPRLFRRVFPDQWQAATSFTKFSPGSTQFSFPLHKGVPIVGSVHNIPIDYVFYIDEPGTYDLVTEARHDVPGPIRLVPSINGKNYRSLVFSKANNKFGEQAIEVQIRSGINSLQLYYNSFDRLSGKPANPEDDYNMLELVRWRLRPKGSK